ncbi:MAG: hypothetical protein ACRYG7_07835 [Janthinobacterium lividum]
MKNGTTLAHLAQLREQQGVHDANYETLQLQRTRETYAAYYNRFQDILQADEEGYEVIITVRSLTKEVTLTNEEGQESFDITALFQKWGNKLSALHHEITDKLIKIENGEPLDGAMHGTGNALLVQAHALCLPQPEGVTPVANAA